MKSKILGMALGLLSVHLAVAAEVAPSLRTVPRVDLNRYLGKWYEIARFPNRFQKDCNQATAEYSLRDDGNIQVVNTCVKSSDQSVDQVTGKAWVVDKESGAKLLVTFLPPFLRWTGIGEGDYWVIDLGADYEFAVVSEPKRKYLWILSRTPEISKSAYEGILGRMREQGFDPGLLISSRPPHDSSIK